MHFEICKKITFNSITELLMFLKYNLIRVLDEISTKISRFPQKY